MAKKDDKHEAEVGEDGEAVAGGGKKKMIIIAAAAVLLVGGGGGGFFFFKKKSDASKEVAKVEPVKVMSFVELPEMTVNLSSPVDRPHFLRMKVALEVSDQKMADQIKPTMPRVVDAFQVYLREMRPADLDGSAGMFRLKDELTRRVNTAVYPNRINAVLFKEFVVQ